MERSFEHELDLRHTLESLAAPSSAPAGGSAAALCGALAAAVTVKVARLSGQDGLAAQAIALGARTLSYRSFRRQSKSLKMTGTLADSNASFRSMNIRRETNHAR